VNASESLFGPAHAARRALVYFFWGDVHTREASASARTSMANTLLPSVAITSASTASSLPDDMPFSQVVTTVLRHDGLLAKADLYRHLPEEFDSFLFLDSDATVIDDVSYGFEKAETFGIAAAMAPHYSLDYFWGFDRVLTSAGVRCASQMQYNTGALFFSRRPDVAEVFDLWRRLALELGPRLHYHSDQPFLTLAMELLHFNAFTLSPAYNYRALGELASGLIRIWHSHAPVPRDVNSFSEPWPPRRFHGDRAAPY
jgi:hypothetical protein